MKIVTAIGGLSLMASAGAAFAQSPPLPPPLPVEFGTPSTLAIGPNPLPDSVNFGLAWSAGDIGSPITSNVTVTLHASSNLARIVPSTAGHAINTKGHGGKNNRVEARAAGPGSPVRNVTYGGLRVISSSPTLHVSQHEFVLWTDLDNDGTLELSPQRLLLGIEFSLFQGELFTTAPQYVPLPDGSIEIIADFTTPSGVVTDPNLDISSIRYTAQIIPAPGAAALLTAGGLLAARRRRKPTQRYER